MNRIIDSIIGVCYNKMGRKQVGLMIVIILSVIFITYIAVGLIVTRGIMKNAFTRVDRIGSNRFSLHLSYSDIEETLPRRDVSFLSGRDKLIGAIYGEQNHTGLVVIVHGFGGDKETHLHHALFFAQQGWKVLTYSGTGVSPSEGNSRISLFQAVTDLRAALDFISTEQELNSLPVVLLGHSQGGFAVCSVLNFEESRAVRAVASFAGMNRAKDMIDSGGRQMTGIFYSLVRPFLFITNRADFTMGSRYSAISGINSTDINVMLVHGTEDTLIRPDREAITNFAEEITNPNATIIMLNDEWNRDHVGVVEWSQEAHAYRTQIQQQMKQRKAEHNTATLTDDDWFAWADTVQLDRIKLNSIDTELFSRVETFFRGAIQ